MHLLWAKKILRNIIHSHSNFASIYHAQWRKLYAEQYLPEFIDCQIFFLPFLHEIVLNTKQFFYCVFFGLLNGGVWYMFVSFSFFYWAGVGELILILCIFFCYFFMWCDLCIEAKNLNEYLISQIEIYLFLNWIFAENLIFFFKMTGEILGVDLLWSHCDFWEDEMEAIDF